MKAPSGSRQRLAFACGHHRRVSLPAALAPEGREIMLRLLRGSSCAACRIEQRRLFARRLNAVFGLHPLQGDPEQVGIAEDVRAYVLQMFAPSPLAVSVEQDRQALAQVIAVLNRRLDAAFWVERRSVLWEKSARYLEEVLASLLQAESGSRPPDAAGREG